MPSAGLILKAQYKNQKEKEDECGALSALVLPTYAKASAGEALFRPYSEGAIQESERETERGRGSEKERRKRNGIPHFN
ncbi:MAG TPA: hypothetical protein VK628_09150 [Flavitalea sp.]|nr:hypothetical protein [Flavitalea sp.]